jgi:Glycosyltransferase family 87
LICAVVLLGALGLLGVALYQNAANRDVVCYWSSAKLLWAHGNPYATGAILRAEQGAGGAYREPFIMRNPPWTLFLVAPLGLFSLRAGAFLWVVALIGAALVSVRLLRRGTRPPPLAVYCFAPILGCAMAGQTSVFVLAGFTLFLKLRQKRCEFLAGAALVLAAIKPHLFLLVWPVLAVEAWRKREFRMLAGLGTALGAATALAVALDPHVFAHYFAAMRSEQIEQQYLPNLSCTLRALTPGRPAWVEAMPTVLGLLWAARFYWRRRANWDWWDHGVELLLISAVVSPYSWPFDQILYLPAILYANRREMNRVAIPALTVINGIAVLLLVLTMPLSSPAYALSGLAVVAWYVWTRREGTGHWVLATEELTAGG